jgi:hypothetical protein
LDGRKRTPLFDAESGVKPGYFTTEFWGTLTASTVVLLNWCFHWQMPSDALGSLAVLMVGYALSRGIAKNRRQTSEVSGQNKTVTRRACSHEHRPARRHRS